jgi:hypothetical protein
MSPNISIPPTASSLYTTLHTTALAFIDAQTQDPSCALRMDFDRIRGVVTPDFTHSWGHNYAVSLSPHIQGTSTFDQFISYLGTMLPRLESWETNVTDVLVDEMKRTVVLRISFMMEPKRGGEGKGDKGEVVENDLVWILEMDEQGKKVRGSREFVDGVAAGRIRELLMGGKK